MAAVTGDDIWVVFNEGWSAAAAGRPEDTNPYPDSDVKHQVWGEGWMANRTDPVGGHTTPRG